MKKHFITATFVLLCALSFAQRQTFERITVTDLGQFQKAVMLRDRFADSISIDPLFTSVTNRTLTSALAIKTALQNKLNIADTAFKWANKVYRKTGTDSVFYNIGGIPIFAFKDSTGGLVANIGNSDLTLTANRSLTLGGYSLSYKIGSNTVEHTFANGNKWFGNGTPSDHGERLQVNGDMIVTGAFTQNALVFGTGLGIRAIDYNGNDLRVGYSATSAWGSVTLFTGTASKYSHSSSLTTLSNSTINLATLKLQFAGTDFIDGNTTTLKFGQLSGSTAYFTKIDYMVKSGAGSVKAIARQTATGTRIGDGNDPDACAILDIYSTTQGMLPPRLTAAQASAITSLVEGLMLYVKDTNATFTAKGWWGWNGSAWEKLNN